MRVVTSPDGAELHFESGGRGTCVLVLHGAYSAHEEIRGALDPILASHDGYRRIYPDLPGMGASPAHESVQSSADVVDLLDELVRAEIGNDPFLVIGHSYGGHLARGIAARHPEQVAGLALICPMMPPTTNAEEHVVVRAIGQPTDLLEPEHLDEYTGYFVIQTPGTAERFRVAVAPAIGRHDGDAVERIMTSWRLDPDPDRSPFDRPTLVLTGRHDSSVGFRDQLALLDHYPGASYVVVADAGHALPHEQPDLVAHLVDDWLARRAGGAAGGASDVTRPIQLCRAAIWMRLPHVSSNTAVVTVPMSVGGWVNRTP